MPSSRPHAIPIVVGIVQSLRPRSILDVGVGFGKWGHLFREYTDIVAAESHPERYQKGNWRTRIDGIEAHTPYLTPMHRFLYDTLHEGSAETILPTLDPYDLIFIGDMLEHLPKEDGKLLLNTAVQKASSAVVVSTPSKWVEQTAVCGNELERHLSHWTADDFCQFPRGKALEVEGEILIGVLPAPDVSVELRAAAPPSGVLRHVRNTLIRVLGRERFVRLRQRLFGKQLLDAPERR